jgi:hypothetical protein
MNPHRKQLTPTKVDTIKKLTRGLVFKSAQQESLCQVHKAAPELEKKSGKK